MLEHFHDHGHHNVVVERMGIPDRYIEHGSVPELYEEIGLTSEEVVTKLRSLIPRKRQRA